MGSLLNVVCRTSYGQFAAHEYRIFKDNFSNPDAIIFLRIT